MKKVYLLASFLALSSGAMAHPCDPDAKDYNPDKCATDIQRGELRKEMAKYQEWLDDQKMKGIKVPVFVPKGQLIEKYQGALKNGDLVSGGIFKGGVYK